MSRRGSESICLLCQCGLRPRSTPPLRPSSFASRRQITSRKSNRYTSEYEGRPKTLPRRHLVFTPAELQQQLELSSATDVLRRVMLGPNAIIRSRSINERIAEQFFNIRYDGDSDTQPRDAAYQRYRNLDDSTGATVQAATELLRMQIKACQRPEEVVHVLSTALGRERDGKRAWERAKLVENPFIHALIKAKMRAGWHPVASMALVGLLVSRLEQHGLQVSLGLLFQALLAAAQTHSMTSFRRYFRMWWQRNWAMGTVSDKGRFVQLLTSLSRGFEHNPVSTVDERRKAVLEVLFGSADPESEKYSLSNLILTDDFHMLGPWVSLLADCKAGDRIWNEWEAAKTWGNWSLQEKPSDPAKVLKFERHRAGLFILALFRADQPHRAWQVFQEMDPMLESNLPTTAKHDDSITTDNQNPDDIAGIHTSVWQALLANRATKPTLTPSLQNALDEAYIHRLEPLLNAIERRMGVVWQKPHSGHSADADTEGGFHVPLRSTRTKSTATEDKDAADAADATGVDEADFDELVEEILAHGAGEASTANAKRDGRGIGVDALAAAVAESSRRLPVKGDQDVLDTLESAVGRVKADSEATEWEDFEYGSRSQE